MKKLSLLTLSAVTLGTLALVGCSAVEEKVSPDSLVAAFTATAPDMAVGAADPVWAKARPLSTALTGGANFGAKPGEKATRPSP